MQPAGPIIVGLWAWWDDAGAGVGVVLGWGGATDAGCAGSADAGCAGGAGGVGGGGIGVGVGVAAGGIGVSRAGGAVVVGSVGVVLLVLGHHPVFVRDDVGEGILLLLLFDSFYRKKQKC